MARFSAKAAPLASPTLARSRQRSTVFLSRLSLIFWVASEQQHDLGGQWHRRGECRKLYRRRQQPRHDLRAGAVATAASASFQDNVVSGGVTNAGTIRAVATGIGLYAVSTFDGRHHQQQGRHDLGRCGRNPARVPRGDGVPVSSFVGNIVNSGTITAKTGIDLFDSTIIGAIVDSGTIKATSHGILIDSASEILASKTAIDIAGPTFTGGISNFGVISGSAGIEINSAHPVSIFDAGRHRRQPAARRSSSPAAATRSRSAPAIPSAAPSIPRATTPSSSAGPDRVRSISAPSDTIQRLHHLQRGRRHLDGQRRQHRALERQWRHAGGCERRRTDQHDGEQRAACLRRRIPGGTASSSLRQGRRHGNHRVGRHE